MNGVRTARSLTAGVNRVVEGDQLGIATAEMTWITPFDW